MTILQLPSVRMVLSQESDNGHQRSSNSKCTRCVYTQTEEDAIDEGDMKKEASKIEEIEVKEVKLEEMIFKYPACDQHNYNKCILSNDVNRNGQSLLELNTKDETYDWKQFSID